MRIALTPSSPQTLVVLLTAACVVLTVSVDGEQTRDARVKPAAGTAILGGTVTSHDEGARPVRRALVTLSGAAGSGDLQVVTDDAGRFVFAQLPAGRYTLTAEKPAFVKTYFDSKRPGRGPATPIAIADGQRLTDIAIRLMRGAAIEGTVIDENGVPLSSAQIMAWQPIMVNGERKLVRPVSPIPWATTDDRGRYRIYGLAPGEYTIRAGGGSAVGGGTRLTTTAEITAALSDTRGSTVQKTAGPRPQAEEAPQVSRTFAYFPGTADGAMAEFVTLAAGEERTGVDVRSVLVRSSRLEGSVVGPNGQPLRNVLVGLANLSSGGLWASPGFVRPRADGRFSMASITPGRYAFFGRGTDADVNATPDASLPLWTWTEVTVNEQDVVDVVMQFLPGAAVSGRLVFDGSRPAPELTKLRLSLLALPVVTGAAVSNPSLTPKPDGAFEFRGVPPGRYRLTIANAGSWSLRTAVTNGADVLDKPLEVPPGQDVSNIVITLTDRPAGISGTLFDQLGRPAPEYAIVVFSTDRGHWTTAPRRMSGIVKVGSDGKFEVSGLPAGEYYLAALTDPDASLLADTSFLEQLAAASIRFTLAEGDKKVQDLKIGG